MGNDNKSTVQELGRWLRLGTLTLTTLSPIVDVLITRLRRSSEEARHKAEEPSTNADLQERLLVVGGALSDLVHELKNNPYAQDLRKRGEDIADELIERGNKLSQTVVERGNQLSHTVVKRGSELTQDLVGRSEQASKELSRRSEQVRRELAEHSNPSVLIAGFSVGLLTAAILVYLLIRKRLQQSRVEEEPHIELPSNGRSRDNVIAAKFNQVAEPISGLEVSSTAEDPITSEVATADLVPFDAVLVGIVDTQRYYPIEISLDQLNSSGYEAVEVVYFVSEEEAKAQGFLPAE